MTDLLSSCYLTLWDKIKLKFTEGDDFLDFPNELIGEYSFYHYKIDKKYHNPNKPFSISWLSNSFYQGQVFKIEYHRNGAIKFFDKKKNKYFATAHLVRTKSNLLEISIWHITNMMVEIGKYPNHSFKEREVIEHHYLSFSRIGNEYITLGKLVDQNGIDEITIKKIR